MGQDSGFDAYSPREIAERVEALCLTKATTPLLSLVMLGVLAGAFIGLGSLCYWLWTNLVPVIAGNLVGGSVLVALVYYVIYRRPARTA